MNHITYLKFLAIGPLIYTFLYSYLHYGLLHARPEVLKASNGRGYSCCTLGGHQGIGTILASFMFCC
jgi:apyrase